MISVIVPVYNSEKTLQKCIESILNQSFRCIEIIVVNDGSTDKSLAICEALTQNDKRIKIYTQNNEGIASVRNRAVGIANGNYIAYVDSDDWLEPDYLNTLYNQLILNDADASICEYWYELEHADGNVITRSRYDDGEVTCFSKNNFLEKLFLDDELKSRVWCMLAKRELFEGVIFPVGCYYEDTHSVFKLFLDAEKIVKINTPLYHYLIHENSITSSNNKNLQKDEDYLKALLEQYSYITNNSILFENFAFKELIYSYFTRFYNLKKENYSFYQDKSQAFSSLDRKINSSIYSANFFLGLSPYRLMKRIRTLFLISNTKLFKFYIGYQK